MPTISKEQIRNFQDIKLKFKQIFHLENLFLKYGLLQGEMPTLTLVRQDSTPYAWFLPFLMQALTSNSDHSNYITLSFSPSRVKIQPGFHAAYNSIQQQLYLSNPLRASVILCLRRKVARASATCINMKYE